MPNVDDIFVKATVRYLTSVVQVNKLVVTHHHGEVPSLLLLPSNMCK